MGYILLIIWIVCYIAALVCFVQQRVAVVIELFIIYVIFLAAKISCVTFFGGQKTFGSQCFQTDKIRIACKSGKRLVRRVAVAGRPQRQDLPVRLPGF